MNDLPKFCLLLAVIFFTTKIYAEDINTEETVDDSLPGQGIPIALANLFPSIEEPTTKSPFRRRYFSNDVRIPPAYRHLYPDVFFRRVKRDLYTINFDEYVPSPLTDFYGFRAQNERLQYSTTENVVETTTDTITTTPTTTTRRPRRPMNRRRRPKDPAARARARQRLANRDQRIPPAFADLYPPTNNSNPLNVTEIRRQNRTRQRPDFPSRIPPAFQHLYPEAQNPDTTLAPNPTTVDDVVTTKKPRRRPDFPSRIPPAYQHLYPDPATTTPAATTSSTTLPSTTQTAIETTIPNVEQTHTTAVDTTPFLITRSGFEDSETTTAKDQVQVTAIEKTILIDLKDKVDSLIQLKENQVNRQLTLEQKISSIENILTTKYETIQLKMSDILKQIVRLESQNNRLDSALYVLRKNSISIKHSLDSLINTTIAEISRDITKKMDYVLRSVDSLRNDLKQSSTLHFKRSTIINTDGNEEGINFYAIEGEGNLLPKNCLENQNKGFNKSGVYRIYPLQSSLSFFAFCDNGWTVVQNRNSGKINFTQSWNDYKLGFGNIEEEFWLGLEKIHILTNYDKVELMIELEDFNSVKTYAHYNSFAIGSEFEDYSLYLLGNYTGTAGDYLRGQVGQKFTTFDHNLENNDKCNGQNLGGWWTIKNECVQSNLNGWFKNASSNDLENDRKGIYWNNINGQQFKSSRMLIRPSVEN
ncbi:fibrinogen C domain-containing protein 1-B-like isoform X2 [Chrysoperla carnea]|uniref:fibrinogen C domain-containing protein 1-B-like isoform X2 n=1 Tax=Chrysoperla carnea TaxID=189513 RepID=UPI001D08E204|nr:fibrinogen C domain-containing protein 1-B-like isoform X2 [Chrysoperla carnea]